MEKCIKLHIQTAKKRRPSKKRSVKRPSKKRSVKRPSKKRSVKRPSKKSSCAGCHRIKMPHSCEICRCKQRCKRTGENYCGRKIRNVYRKKFQRGQPTTSP